MEGSPKVTKQGNLSYPFSSLGFKIAVFAARWEQWHQTRTAPLPREKQCVKHLDERDGADPRGDVNPPAEVGTLTLKKTGNWSISLHIPSLPTSGGDLLQYTVYLTGRLN